MKCFFFSFIVVLCGGTLWYLQRFLKCIKYIMFEFTPSTSLLYPPLPLIPRLVSTCTILAFIHVWTHFFAPYSPYYPFASWAGPVPPSYYLIFLRKKREKVERKTLNFCLFEIKVATGSFLVIFPYVYMDYNPN
jgi:hypothetical protein